MLHLTSFATLLATLVTQSYSIDKPGEGCDPDGISVQENFDPIKYNGKRYEVGWLPFYFEDPAWAYIDYVEIYNSSGGQEAIDTLSYGRIDSSYDNCNTKNRQYNYSSTAKYYFAARNGNGTTIQADYWIISTDYTHYSLVYGCTEMKEPPMDNTCKIAHAWLWSRNPKLDDSYYDIVNGLLPSLCLTPSDLIRTGQEKDCVTMVTSNDSRELYASPLHILIAVLIFINIHN